MKKRINILTSIAFVLYLATIALLCFLHGEDLPNVTGTWFGLPADKVAHALMFLPFIPLSFFSFNTDRNGFIRDMLLLIGLAIVGVGSAYLTELIQDQLGYRRYELKDFISDGMGLAAGFGLISLWLIIKHSRKRK